MSTFLGVVNSLELFPRGWNGRRGRGISIVSRSKRAPSVRDGRSPTFTLMIGIDEGSGDVTELRVCECARKGSRERQLLMMRSVSY